MGKKLTARELIKKKVPYILIPGLLLASALGWHANEIRKIQSYYELRLMMPTWGITEKVIDGDTFDMRTGFKVRLLGIDAPNRGQKGYKESKDYLAKLLGSKKVHIEYDRYQDDKFGRLLVWAWIDCEKTPEFKKADYMYKSPSESMPGLLENPDGCKNGKLINEELARSGHAKPVFYKDRGELKYQQRLSN